MRDLYVFSGGFLRARLRQALAQAGWRVRIGWPGPDDWVGVWGASPTAWRGERVARHTGAKVLRVEDAFLRSLFPGRTGEASLGLMLDESGVYFDATAPSDLETLLATARLDDPHTLARAEAAMTRMRSAHLTKFAAVDPDLPVPEPGFVLVIDQVRGDAAAREPSVFGDMLKTARAENPGLPIVIKTHPETAQGHRPGHFTQRDLRPEDTLLDTAVSPWRLFDAASAVYTVSSLAGFEAILAGHRPRVFGQPFYAGWGLSVDQHVFARRGRPLTPAQLFAGAMIEMPRWNDPYRGAPATLEMVMDTLEAQARVWREDRQGYTAIGLRRWKRPHMRAFFGHHTPLRFDDNTPRAGTMAMLWGDSAGPAGAVRVEDGYLRSRGLGARLVPPLSLVVDRQGLGCDPTGPSDLEALIARSSALSPSELARAGRLIARLKQTGLSKYGPGGPNLPPLPEGHCVLVTGQVADDASVRLGCTGGAKTDRDVLSAARAARPEATLIFKPHPDVLAGLRDGETRPPEADVILSDADPALVIDAVDEVWTLTSTLGFEALIRDTPVTCLGMPFYAGWGLTQDQAPVPSRRGITVSLAGLVHACLIAYPRYLDPVTGLPCPAEVAVDRLLEGAYPIRRDPIRKVLYQLQGLRSRLNGS